MRATAMARRLGCIMRGRGTATLGWGGDSSPARCRKRGRKSAATDRPIAPLWQPGPADARLCPMDTANPAPNNSVDAPRLETEAEKQRRLAWEAEMIAKARASAAAGRVVSSEEVDAWIDSLDTDHELPPPRSGR